MEKVIDVTPSVIKDQMYSRVGRAIKVRQHLESVKHDKDKTYANLRNPFTRSMNSKTFTTKKPKLTCSFTSTGHSRNIVVIPYKLLEPCRNNTTRTLPSKL